MSQEKVKIVQRAMAAYMGNDEATVRKLVAPDIVVSTRPDQPDVREHHGYDGMLRASAEWLEAWDEQTFEAARIWDAEDFVFVGTRESGRGKISGPDGVRVHVRVHAEPGEDCPHPDLWL